MGLFKQELDYFGLDIGSSGLRAVHLKHGSQKPSLQSYGLRPLPTNLTASDAPVDIARVASEIKQLVKNAKIDTKYVVAGVPSAKVFASIITTPKLNHQELKKA